VAAPVALSKKVVPERRRSDDGTTDVSIEDYIIIQAETRVFGRS
jgi:hypothetical protein